ncbi:MAG: gliding motility lipoprotein GldD [Prevotellaceae bacterium]|jgi:gliding motility-associated lipoprotein GldD|nr:gliding motility lipoprotein GldD [Prevotellaceae bacterium]
MKKYLFCVLTVVLLVSCGRNAIPKPYAYYRIDLPDHAYTMLDTTIPYRFEMSQYAHISPCPDELNWINIDYPQWHARLHLSFVPLHKDTFQTVAEESRTLVYKHTIKANAIIEQYYGNDTARVYGILYDVTGNAASSIQFFVTDSVAHFLRGALYFNNLPNADSIAPVNNYIREDIVRLIETLQWK